MEFKARAFNPATLKVDALVLVIPTKGPLGTVAGSLDQAAGGVISAILKNGELGKNGNHLTLYAPAGIEARKLVLLGGGEKPPGETQFQKLAGRIATQLTGPGIKTAASDMNREVVWS